MIHTLTTHSAARRLAQAAADERLASLPEILIQVNVDEDPAKDGIAAAQVDAFLDTLPDEIAIAGFMTMPAWAEDPEQSRTAFAQLRGLRDELSANWQGRHSLMYLSMGTSQDFAVAIEEGATHVRLGRILFSGGE
jgi:uncharacterized pyridoxal phosphate-containing UPF0001 family protein